MTSKDLENCRWFRRGWTLQELIAPNTLELYDAEWALRGTKHQYWEAIRDVARISKDGLLNFKAVLESQEGPGFPVAQRMYWASRRETTRPEDIAYCLFGLFDVNLPLLYGEGGKKAFMRLQTAILEATQDLTLLAWKLPASTTDTARAGANDTMEVDHDTAEAACGVLAPHPRAFDHDIMRRYQDAEMAIYYGAEELGYRSQVDASLLRVKAPRLITFEDTGDRIFLYSGITYQATSSSKYPDRTLWIPLAQLGNIYGRLHPTGEPTARPETFRGATPLEEIALLIDSSRRLGVGREASTVKFDAKLPGNMVIHALDAGPKDSWNPFSQVLSLPVVRDEGTGYLRIRLRRMDGNMPEALSDFHKPSWLDRVALVLPFVIERR